MKFGKKQHPKHEAPKKGRQGKSARSTSGVPEFEGADQPVIIPPISTIGPLDDKAPDDKPHGDVGKTVLKALGIIVLIALVAYLAGVAFFSFHFFPKTTLGSRDVSLMSVDDLAKDSEDALSGYEAHVVGDGIDVAVKGSDIDLKLDAGAYASSAKEQQLAWAWPTELLADHKVTSEVSASCDRDKLADQLSEAVSAINKEGTEPADAKVAFDKDKDAFVVAPEVYGTLIDEQLMTKFVAKHIGQLEETIKPDETCLVQPSKKSDDKTLATGAQNANKLLVGDIELNFNGTKAATIGNEQVSAWIKVNDEGNASFDENKMNKWARGELSKQLDTVGTKRTYKRPDGKKFTVSGGNYGWSIDGAKLSSMVCEQIKSGSNEAIDIPALQEAQTWTKKGGQDWGDTYVDLSIAEQHARFYKKGKLVWESDVVTGNTADGHPTPYGVYQVNGNKGTDQTLLGLDEDKDGKPDYKSQVSYWIPFIDNLVAFHDASWRGAFGGNIYTYAGSHGCVNLPLEKAKQLYDLCDVGTVVVVHH